MMPMRDAAAVVVWRDEGAALGVYMLKRGSRLAAFPSVWAFPGGSVDAEDRVRRRGDPAPDAQILTAWCARVESGPLAVAQDAFMLWAEPQFRARLGYVPSEPWADVRADPEGNRAALVAAIRELGEETGWWVGARPDVRVSAEPRAIEPSAPEWKDGAGSAPVPDWGRLAYIGRLITPPHERVRFNCRFFAVESDDGRLLDWPAGEATEARWVRVDEVLAQDAAAFPLAMPTRYLLERLARTPPAVLRGLTLRERLG